MLLFIICGIKHFHIILAFKYISCYYLSFCLHLLNYKYRIFKYISCYYLSNRSKVCYVCWRIQIHLMLLFILILFLIGSKSAYSNTSHVIIYPNMRLECTHPVRNSNTSHVIIYLKKTRPFVQIICIQIHLMLLFI